MKRKTVVFGLLTLVVASGCLGGSASSDPIEDMQISFEGDHDREGIKTVVDDALRNFGTEVNDENRRELGNIALNAAHEKDYVDSMDVLECMRVANPSEFTGDTTVEKLESAAVFCAE